MGDPGTVQQGGSRFDKTDLKVYKEGMDNDFVGKHAIFSVNGFHHITDYGPDGVFVVGGNHSLRHANDNQIGLLSFEDIGEIKCVPITDDMVTGNQGDVPLRKGAYVTIPDHIDIENKTTLLVLGGYLQVLGKTYTRVSDRTYRIQLEQLNLLERYYDSRPYLDFSSLGLDVNDDNPTKGIDEFFQDDTLRAYLTLPEFLDRGRRQLLPRTGTAGAIGVAVGITHTDYHPYPVVGAYGRTLNTTPFKKTYIGIGNGS